MTGDMQAAFGVTAAVVGVSVVVLTFSVWFSYVFRRIF